MDAQMDASPDLPAATCPTDAGPTTASHATRRFAVRLLGVLAFLVLAVALCARPLLNEGRTVPVEQLLSAPEGASSASLMVRHTMHLLAAGGIVLAVLWTALGRWRWRLCGLEMAVLLMIGAALLSLPVASDKRLATNSTIDRVLPLIAGAALYQLLVRRPAWRRVLLAGVVAAATANCAKATAKWWEYRQQWNEYQEQKVEFWSQRNVGLDDPRVAGHEAFLRGRRPISFIQGPNVTGSFILLGLIGTGAVLLGGGRRRVGGRLDGSVPGEESAIESAAAVPPQPGPSKDAASGGVGGEPADGAGPARSASPGVQDTRGASWWLSMPARALLLLLVLWHLVVLGWIQTAGTKVALLAALAAGAVSLRLRDRPRRLAVALVAGLVLLQGTLMFLALSPTDLRRGFLNYTGAGGNIRTLGQRLFIYERAIELFREHPVTGVGPSQFDKHYPAAKSAYSSGQVAHAHNWLLNAAACRGTLGVLGVLVALGGCGWVILRALARPADVSRHSAWSALLPTILVILACWLVVMSDMPRSLWPKILPFPVAASLVAGVAVSLRRLNGPLGHLALLAGLVGFVVHCTVEVTPGVPDVMWPFWGVVVVAMAWNGPARQLRRGVLRRYGASAAPLLAGAAAMAVVMLTVPPMRAVALMHQAQRAAGENNLESAASLLRASADADPLDPLPLKAAAFVRYRHAQADPVRAVEHYREYVELSRAAVERNPLDHTYWRSLALANMYLASVTGDFAHVDEAIDSIRRALELNPQWPAGWLELARMAAVEGNQPDRPTLLKTAIDAADRALSLEESRPEEIAPRLSAQELAELQRMRAQLSRRLKAASSQPAA